MYSPLIAVVEGREGSVSANYSQSLKQWGGGGSVRILVSAQETRANDSISGKERNHGDHNQTLTRRICTPAKKQAEEGAGKAHQRFRVIRLGSDRSKKTSNALARTRTQKRTTGGGAGDARGRQIDENMGHKKRVRKKAADQTGRRKSTTQKQVPCKNT